MTKVRDGVPQVEEGQGKITTADKKGVRIYLASPFFDEEQIKRVEKLEQALQSNPTVDEVFSPMHNQLDHLEFGSLEWRQAVYENDIKHVNWADVVVMIHDYFDTYTDSGTAFEMGYAVAKGKPVVVLQYQDKVPVNLMISESLTAYFLDVDKIAEYDFKNLEKIPFYGEVF